MKFQYTEKKVSLPTAVHAYAEKKVKKLDRFFDRDAEVLVAFSVEKNSNKVEITINAAGTYFRASESTSDMYASIDAAVSTIERQIRKNKTRLSKNLRSEAIVPEVPQEFDVQEEHEFEIVRTKRFAVKPMSPDEAILQMNLLGHGFFVFRNTDDNTIAVVYRRNNGGYGIIEADEQE